MPHSLSEPPSEPRPRGPHTRLLGSLRELSFALACVLLGVSIACAEADAPTSLRSIREHPDFEVFQAELRALVERDGKAGDNHFFVARYPEGSSTTYMFWREGRRVWILTLGGSTPDSWSAVRFPAAGERIDLDTDVVDRPEEVGSSTFLVDRAWIQERIYEAVVDGDLIPLRGAASRAPQEP